MGFTAPGCQAKKLHPSDFVNREVLSNKALIWGELFAKGGGGGSCNGGMFQVAVGGNGLKHFGIDAPPTAARWMNSGGIAQALNS
jgi:hypothetical protein